MIHQRVIGLGAAAILVAGAAGAAFAHPHPGGDGDGKKVERIVIIRDGAGGDHHGKPGTHEVRRFEIIGADGAHHGGPGEPVVRRFEMHGDMLDRCDGGEKVVDESADAGDKKTKVVICTKGRPSAASAERLEEALARIKTNDELSAEQKARITTALQSAIDRARSAR
jgi:rhodanese-related sulfurtransferase